MKFNLSQTRSAPTDVIDKKARKISFILVSDENEGIRKPCCEEPYIEKLDVNGAIVSNLRTFFKAHNRSVDSAIGKIDNVRVEDNKLKADVTFGTTQDADVVFQKYRDGILTDVSFGYSIRKYEIDDSGDIPVVTITEFEIDEVSAVGIGFDRGAKVGREAELINEEIEVNPETENKQREKGENVNEIIKLAKGYIRDGKDAVAVMELAESMTE